jgi:flagellar hook-length control protein FliK
LSGPANILLPQGKPPVQGSNAQPEAADTPFASVLQQKVKSGKEDSKPAETTTAQAPTEQANASQQAPQADAKSETPTAEAVVKGDHAETALQQLLPWLQSLQGQNTKPEDKDETAATDALLLPTAAAVTPQTQSLQGMDLGGKAGARKDTIDEPGLQADLLKEDVKTASATANLAATNELAANKQKPDQESFDAVLQDVRADARASHAGTTQATATKQDGEPTRLQAPVGTPQWQNEFSDRVQLMSRNNEGRAELILTPPHMGRIEVTLNINGDQANAMFISANPEVRTALEGAMDRLREALANNGIALGQAQVGAESSGQSYGGQNGNRQSAALGGGGIQEGGTSAAWTRHSNNMLDVFA